MASAKPPRPPAFDAKAFVAPLWTTYNKVVYRPEPFPNFVGWIRSVRDAVSANAVYLDEVKTDVDAHSERLDIQAARIKALEDAPSVPFPGSG